MKNVFLLLLVTALLGGCVVYPGYYGDYDSGYYYNGYYGYPYGYAGPNINLFYSGHYGLARSSWPVRSPPSRAWRMVSVSKVGSDHPDENTWSVCLANSLPAAGHYCLP